MKFSRRELLKTLALHLPLWSGVAALSALPGSVSAAEPPSALGPFLDVLIPGDETPSATQAGMDRTIGSIKQLAPYVIKGCEWLDNEARRKGGREFATLNEVAQIQIVRQAENSPATSLPRLFFELMLDLCYQIYYTHEEAWAGIGYTGPPQPLGFMDFAAPPGKSGT